MHNDGNGPARQLETQAMKCRRLARAVSDESAADALTAMAAEYEQKARRIQRPGG